jgi:hypothetical protein
MGTYGLDAFLFHARVPSVSSPLYSCGRGWPTGKHVIIFVPRHAAAWHDLRNEQGHLSNFSMLLWTAEGLQKTIKCVMQRGILGQFRGGRDVLYGLPSPSPQHKTYFGIDLKYWRLQRTLQMTH